MSRNRIVFFSAGCDCFEGSTCAWLCEGSRLDGSVCPTGRVLHSVRMQMERMRMHRNAVG